MSLDNFKNFVKEQPDLLSFVNRGEMSWQDFYNLHELYGPNHNVWDKYIKNDRSSDNSSGASAVGGFTLGSIVSLFKNIKMQDIQSGIGSLQKGIGYLRDMIGDKATSNREEEYEPRPIHRSFDD